MSREETTFRSNTCVLPSPGSTQNGIAGVVANHHIWFNLVGGVPVVIPPTTTPGNGGTVPAIPEPASLLLLGSGLAGLAAWRMRRP